LDVIEEFVIELGFHYVDNALKTTLEQEKVEEKQLLTRKK
jgi:hypothetical protein